MRSWRKASKRDTETQTCLGGRLFFLPYPYFLIFLTHDALCTTSKRFFQAGFSFHFTYQPCFALGFDARPISGLSRRREVPFGVCGRVFILISSFDFQMRFILKPICSTVQRCLFFIKDFCSVSILYSSAENINISFSLSFGVHIEQFLLKITVKRWCKIII